MENVVSLFSGVDVTVNVCPRELLVDLAQGDTLFNKAVVILIDDRAGNWTTTIHSSGMSNADVVLANRIIERKMLDAMMNQE